MDELGSIISWLVFFVLLYVVFYISIGVYVDGRRAQNVYRMYSSWYTYLISACYILCCKLFYEDAIYVPTAITHEPFLQLTYDEDTNNR